MYSVKGIDVSHWQEDINWDLAVTSDHVEFAYIKATEANKGVDGWFNDNWNETKRLKIPRGAYHFFRPQADPVKQAFNFAQTTGIRNPDNTFTYQGELTPMLDFEVQDGVIKNLMVGKVEKFIKEFKKLTGLDVGIYTRANIWNQFMPRVDWAKFHMLWCAHWTYALNLPYDIPIDWKDRRQDLTFWQYSNKGKIPGIRGDVDLNVYKGTTLEFNKQFGTGIKDDIQEEPPMKSDHVTALINYLRIREAPTVTAKVVGQLMLNERPDALEEKIVGDGIWIRIGWKQWAAMKYGGSTYLKYS